MFEVSFLINYLVFLLLLIKDVYKVFMSNYDRIGYLVNFKNIFILKKCMLIILEYCYRRLYEIIDMKFL